MWLKSISPLVKEIEKSRPRIQWFFSIKIWNEIKNIGSLPINLCGHHVKDHPLKEDE
jgi:hypothetical protein